MATRGTKKASESLLVDQVQLENFIEKSNEQFFQRLEKKFEKMESTLNKIQEKFENIEKKAELHETKIKEIHEKLENISWNQQKNILRFDGLPEEENENILEMIIKIIDEKLKVKCDEKDLDDVFRMGKHSQNKQRTVVVKFLSYIKRNMVFKARKLFAGSGVYINEHLNFEQYKLFIAARRKYGNQKVWTLNGKIFVRTENGIQNIKSINDLSQ